MNIRSDAEFDIGHAISDTDYERAKQSADRKISAAEAQENVRYSESYRALMIADSYRGIEFSRRTFENLERR